MTLFLYFACLVPLYTPFIFFHFIVFNDYDGCFFKVLADVTLPESSYKSTACSTPSGSPVSLNCSTSLNDADIIAISSFKAIAKKQSSVCLRSGGCCHHSETADCVFPYYNVRNPAESFELYQECMGHERMCRHPVRVPRIPTPQECLNIMLYPSDIEFVEVQYYCIKRKLITTMLKMILFFHYIRTIPYA